ncbi:MAG: tRNA uridine-5-carboxymethylaminomethyl(34) synthesis GTPase MnmE, partial [Muribaculaceae bacterium]|nr:tRNA uridine-5-carboxymethylaminomethyl(34) synthesis GTPase MnmE [Muribaculaceae bacterium]
MTICAISTPAGSGGIAVARISGPQAVAIADSVWQGRPLSQAASHTAHLGTVMDGAEPLDQAVATVFRAPRSFTGEDVVELSVHGSTYVQRRLIQILIDAGARLATPGEFTRRAFAAGKMDLAQAEAVADLIASQDRAAHRIASRQMRGAFSQRLAALRQQLTDLASLLELELDFSEEDVEFASRRQLLDIARQIQDEVTRLAASFRVGQAIKTGIPVAIVGPTNAGKSSLLNALLGDDRAIVSDIHGTTRDIVEDTLAIGDYTFRLMDTAGLRHTADAIETIGIERSRRAAASATIVIALTDATAPAPVDLPDTAAHVIHVANKIDLLPAAKSASEQPEFVSGCSEFVSGCALPISAKTGQGIPALKERMSQIAALAENRRDALLVA